MEDAQWVGWELCGNGTPSLAAILEYSCTSNLKFQFKERCPIDAEVSSDVVTLVCFQISEATGDSIGPISGRNSGQKTIL